MASSSTSETTPDTIDRHALAIFPPLAMLAGMQLDLFTTLKDGPLTAEEISAAVGVKPTRLAPLLYALAIADLLTVQDDRFGNTAETDTFLVAGRANYLSGRQEFFADTWPALLGTSASIRADAPQTEHDFHAMSEAEMLAFFRGQHLDALQAGGRLASAHDFTRFQHLLDVGGGSGGLAISSCRLCPELRATVADLPKVIPVTVQFIAEAGASDRVSTTVADLRAGPVSGSYDVAVVRNVVQVLSLEAGAAVLRNVAASIKPGGQLYVVGSMLDNTRMSPQHLVYINLIFINIYQSGLIYTENEYRSLIQGAGFVDISLIHGSVAGMPIGNAILSARKPG